MPSSTALLTGPWSNAEELKKEGVCWAEQGLRPPSDQTEKAREGRQLRGSGIKGAMRLLEDANSLAGRRC